MVRVKLHILRGTILMDLSDRAALDYHLLSDFCTSSWVARYI